VGLVVANDYILFNRKEGLLHLFIIEEFGVADGHFLDGFALGLVRASAPYRTQAAEVVRNCPPAAPRPHTQGEANATTVISRFKML
jgi:hypothetical protein